MNIQALSISRAFTRGRSLVATAIFLAFMLPGPVLAQGMMSEQMYNRLERVHQSIEEDDYATAREQLESARERADNAHERSVIAQLSGYIYLNQEDYRNALEDFEAAVEYGGLPLPRQLTTITNVAQLHAQFEEYREAIGFVEEYLSLIEESEDHETAPPRVHLIGGQSHMQLGEFREALPYVRSAIELADEPNESHYRALLAIHFELQEYAEGIDVLERMLGFWPNKMQYWFQLYSLNMELERDMAALNALSLAHRKGLFDAEDHYLALARMYLFQGAPYEGGEALEEGLEEEVVDRDEDNLRMLSRAWIQAKEYDRAAEVLRDVAEFDESGEPYLRIAQLRQEQAKWEEMYEAAMEAFERGDLEDPGKPLLLAGRAASEQKNYDQALSAFNRAMEYEDVAEQATQWVRYIEEERSLLEQQ